MNSQVLPDGNHSDENATDGDNGPTLNTRLIFASAWIIIAVAGIIGNSLVIYVAVRFQKMTNVTNCFIVNLAITDIVFLAFCMPLLVAQYTLDHWSFNEIICKLMNCISFVSVLVTVLTLVAMTIDRYIYVVRPFQNLRWRKPRTILLLSIIIWLTSCIFASPFYYSYGVINMHDHHHECVLLSEGNVQVYFRIYTVTLYYFIPLTIIIISYTCLLYYVYSKENKLKPKTKNSVVRWSKKRRAVTKMVAVVTLVFSLCWLPITLCIISANLFRERTQFLYYFKVIANSFAYLNSAINPILYAFLNRSFRNNCGSLFAMPVCSLFCAEESPATHVQQQKPQRPTAHPLLPSAQLDRFSYQSTQNPSLPNRHSKKKKKKTSSLIIHVSQPPPDVISPNEFSEEDFEMSDADFGTHFVPEKHTDTTALPSQQYGSSPPDDINHSNLLTTTL